MADALTQEQRDRVQEFIVTYNTLDGELRRRLQLGRETAFSRVLNDFAEKHKGWLDVEYLRTANDLRNLLVHEPKRAYDYVAIPSSAMVAKLKDVCDRILNPERVLPKFGRKVETVAPTNSLAQVLRQIAQRDFSQFPVYTEETFDGLLTENGITRWLAHHVTTDLSYDRTRRGVGRSRDTRRGEARKLAICATGRNCRGRPRTVRERRIT